MKWIKYQIVQSTVGEETILVNKKVGYSDENLAIAQKEAYNGYEIIDDEQSFEKEPLAIELGGTGANTAEQARQKIGAAPDGFGLGRSAVLIDAGDNLNNYTVGGWYQFQKGVQNAPFDWGIMLIIHGTDYLNDTFQYAFSRYPRNNMAIRQKFGGAWEEWEWINPPMLPGVEYRTTERWEGKPVYTKLVSLGAFTNPLVVTLPGYSAMRVIEAHGELRISENSDNTMMVPGHMDGNKEVWIDQSFAYSQQLRFRSTDGWDWPIGRPFYLRLKYWKYTG